MDKNKNNKERLLLPFTETDPENFPLINYEDNYIDKAIIDNIDSDVVVLDKNFNIVVINKKAEDTFCVRNNNVVGLSYTSLKLKLKEKEIIDNLNKVIEQKEPVNIKKMELISNDNLTKFFDLNYTPIKDKDGKVRGIISVSKDITKRVNKEIKYEKALKLLEALNDELRNKDEEIRCIGKTLQERYCFYNLIGKSYLMQSVFDLIEKVADTDSTVLITGETGTGKELAAQALHFNSSRRDNNFIAVNCAALPESLLESELFGHVKGSFTGAVKDKRGKFELADGGTLFLDEIGETSILTQVKLLRALQEKVIERIGDEKSIKLDIRIIAATNQDLHKLMDEGKFRKDLYYRLNVITVKLPPLNQRTDDIPILTDHFLKKFNKHFNKDIKGVSKKGLKQLINYKWPGNVRELEAVLEKSVILAENDYINTFDIKQSSDKIVLFGPPLKENELLPYNETVRHIEKIEKDYFILVFTKFNGKINDISKFTGLNRRSILNKMKKFNINKANFK